MSGWHREHPELVGTDADPWMIHESYRQHVENLCVECSRPTSHRVGDDFLCERCLHRSEAWTPED